MECSSNAAFILSTEDDVISHGYVFYGLVRPRRDETSKELMLESTAAMVNVVPRKRIYRMESVEELEVFQAELLKRPFVLQPIIKEGSGIQKLNCFFCVQQEKWVILINQTHPKVLGRILMGIDVAKMAVRRGEDFVLEFDFSAAVKRFYHTMMSMKQTSQFSYVDCEFGELVIRYAPSERPVNTRKVQRIRFEFEDIEEQDLNIRRMELAEMECSNPRLSVIPQEELRYILPGWTFEDEMAEETEYSYYNCRPQEERVASRYPARSSRTSHPNRYEVAVDLHVPNDRRNMQETSFTDTELLVSERDNCRPVEESAGQHSGLKYIHTHQNSAGGRSSMADSGFQDDDNDSGGFERNRDSRNRYDRRPQDTSGYAEKYYVREELIPRTKTKDFNQKTNDSYIRKYGNDDNYPVLHEPDISVANDSYRYESISRTQGNCSYKSQEEYGCRSGYENAAFNDDSDIEQDIDLHHQLQSSSKQLNFHNSLKTRSQEYSVRSDPSYEVPTRADPSEMYFQTIEQMKAKETKAQCPISEGMLI